MKIEQMELNYQEQDCLNYRYYNHVQKIKNPKSVIDNSSPYSFRNPIIKTYRQIDPITKIPTTLERAEMLRKHQIQMQYLKDSLNTIKPTIKSYHEKPTCAYVNVRYKQRDDESRMHNIQLNYLQKNIHSVQSPYKQQQMRHIDLSQRNKKQIFIYSDYKEFRQQHLASHAHSISNSQEQYKIYHLIKQNKISNIQEQSQQQEEFYNCIRQQVQLYNLQIPDDFQQFFAKIYFSNYQEVDIIVILYTIRQLSKEYSISSSLKYIRLEMNKLGLDEYGNKQ